MTMVLDWPALNTLAWLRLPCCDAEHPTRVEDFAGDDCVVAQPISPHTEPVKPESVSGGFFLGWANGRGAIEVPVDLVSTAADHLPTWTIRAIGPGTETQRRSFVRLDISMTIELYMLEGGAPTHAELLDISEGGLRCRVDNWAIDPRERVFSLQVTLDGRDYYLRSQLAWRGSADSAGNRELGIRFIDIEQSVSDSIRSYIFAAQLAARRRSLS